MIVKYNNAMNDIFVSQRDRVSLSSFFRTDAHGKGKAQLRLINSTYYRLS